MYTGNVYVQNRVVGSKIFFLGFAVIIINKICEIRFITPIQ